MFKTIEEALRIYKQKLREYYERIERLNAEYEGRLNLGTIDDGDYRYLNEWKHTFEATEEMLGLSKDEQTQITKEIRREVKIKQIDKTLEKE